MRDTPDFSVIIDCFEAFVERRVPERPGVERHLVSEARDLLLQFDPLLQRIEDLNATLTEQHERQMPQPAEILSLLMKQAETDPKLASWLKKNPNPRVAGKASSVNIPLGQRDLADREDPTVGELRRLTETFYRNSHRLLKVLVQLPGLAELSCREISIVRNQLLEHPEGQGTPVTLPSFGYGSAGPRIKPIQASDQAGVHTDPGLFNNAEALFSALREVLCSDKHQASSAGP